MKFAVLVFPGSNCDRDMYNAAIKTGAEAEYVDYRETSLKGFDGVLIPGGFSFGDYIFLLRYYFFSAHYYIMIHLYLLVEMKN